MLLICGVNLLVWLLFVHCGWSCEFPLQPTIVLELMVWQRVQPTPSNGGLYDGGNFTSWTHKAWAWTQKPTSRWMWLIRIVYFWRWARDKTWLRSGWRWNEGNMILNLIDYMNEIIFKLTLVLFLLSFAPFIWPSKRNH